MCGQQIRLSLFKFWPIASKQLNSLATIATLSWLGGAKVTHSLWEQEFSVQFLAPVKFDVWILFCYGFFLFQKHIFPHKIMHFCVN